LADTNYVAVIEEIIAYADELVKEYYSGSEIKRILKEQIRAEALTEGRLAALEEAAKVVQKFKWSTDTDSEVTELLAHKIRALKDKK
jgi:hypothetical protein